MCWSGWSANPAARLSMSNGGGRGVRRRERRRWFLDAYRLFVDAYRAASEALHKGLKDFCFPEGGLPPTWTFEFVTG